MLPSQDAKPSPTRVNPAQLSAVQVDRTPNHEVPKVANSRAVLLQPKQEAPKSRVEVDRQKPPSSRSSEFNPAPPLSSFGVGQNQQSNVKSQLQPSPAKLGC